MKLTNGEIFNAVQSLNQLFGMELPVRTSLSIAKLVGKLDEPFAAIEKVRIGLVNKYGKTDPKTNQISVGSENENFSKFMEDYNELMAQSTELVLDKISLPQKTKGEPFELKPSVLIPLRRFVELEVVELVS